MANEFVFKKMLPFQNHYLYFNNPNGITGDINGFLYIADTENSQIQKITVNGDYVSKWPLSDAPSGIASDHAGNNYVSCQSNHRVYKFDVNGNSIPFEISKELKKPYGIYAFDNKIYITDKHGLHIVSDSGQVIFEKDIGMLLRHLVVSSSGTIYITDSFEKKIWIVSNVLQKNEKEINEIEIKTLTHNTIQSPVGIAIDKQENLYVTDFSANLIHKWNNDLQYMPDCAINIEKPNGIWISPDSFIYVTDKLHNVNIFNSNGKFINRWGTGSTDLSFVSPESIALDKQNNLYVVDSLTFLVKMIDKNGFFLKQFDIKNDVVKPSGIAVNAKNQIYISDKDAGIVYKYNSDGQLLAQSNYLFIFPYDIEIDSQNNIYIANSYNNEIVRCNADLNQCESYNCGQDEPDCLSKPRGVGIDSNDNLFVCDTQHDRIVKMSGKNICETFMDNVHKPTDITIFKDHFFVVETWNHSVKQYDINGNLLQTIAVEGRMPGQLKNPGNCQVNDNGDLFIADVNNYRIQVFSTDTVPDQKAIIVAGGGDYPGKWLFACVYAYKYSKW
jgi:sugar lactone lactonase YvrE